MYVAVQVAQHQLVYTKLPHHFNLKDLVKVV